MGRNLRDECEMRRLLEPDKLDYDRVMAAKNRHMALWRYRTLNWSNPQLVRVGAWLYECAKTLTLFDFVKCRIGRNVLELPKLNPEHAEAIERLRQELELERPYYLPHIEQPPDWTGWRTEYGGKRMSAEFVRDTHPETVAAIKGRFR
jgi:hypothetical protein